MLWPAARVARALWRGVGETAVRRREPCGCSRRGRLVALRLALLNDSFRFRGSQSLFVYHTNKNCKGVSAISKKQGALRRLAGAVTTALAVGMAGFFRTLCLADAGLNGEVAALRPRHGAMRFAHCAYDCPFSKKTGK